MTRLSEQLLDIERSVLAADCAIACLMGSVRRLPEGFEVGETADLPAMRCMLHRLLASLEGGVVLRKRKKTVERVPTSPVGKVVRRAC